MSEAAVPAEAFDDRYTRTAGDELSGLLDHARAYGEANDHRWQEEWRAMYAERDQCPPEPSPCGLSDYYSWQRDMQSLQGRFRSPVNYDVRWRLSRPTARGPWTGFFARNLEHPAIAVYNSYNAGDHVLRVDRGRGPVGTPHAWYSCQRHQKPNVGLGAALIDYVFGLPVGSKDGRDKRFWGLLGGVASNSELLKHEYLWNDAHSHSDVIRQWAELAHWFPATAGPAGAQRLERLDDRNIDFSDMGDSTNPDVSHSFIRYVPLPAVWHVFETFKEVFAR
jgi:hypothetical protein